MSEHYPDWATGVLAGAVTPFDEVRSVGGIAFLSGADTFVARSLEIGADGLALALAAVAPGQYVELLDRSRLDGPEQTSDTARALDPRPAVVFAQPFRDFRARLKEALRQMGMLTCANVRPPLMPLSAAENDAVKHMVATCALGSDG